MKRICAWCGKELGTALSETGHDEVITHGICETCAGSLFSGARTTLRSFLDTLGVPVVVANGAATINTANSAALALLRKDAADVDGTKSGDVFECAFAALPQGCGQTIHCSGCMIRNTVMDTYRTGNSHLKCPATLKRGTLAQPEHIDLLISTEKQGDVVLLRIDRMGDEDGEKVT
ncbi:MAG TPA: hypothetical protein VIH45_05985 [Desulfuromonadaceae bacterium]